MNCPICSGPMNKVQDKIEEDLVDFEAYQCQKCGEELINSNQLKSLATKYRQLRKAKDILFTKWGNSLAIRIPKEIVGQLGIKEGSKGLIKKDKNSITIIPS